MAKSRKEYLRKTRKSRMRNLKHSKTGIIAMVAGWAAVVLFLYSIISSFHMGGEGDFLVGTFSLIGLILAIGAWIVGIMALREPNIRPFPAKCSIGCGCVMTIVLVVFYAIGIM